jgi:hypothetical protein
MDCAAIPKATELARATLTNLGINRNQSPLGDTHEPFLTCHPGGRRSG